MTDCSPGLKSGASTVWHGPRGCDESADFSVIFFPRGEFDAGDDIDSAGIEEADGVGDVGRAETSGDDDRDMLFDALDDGNGSVPVENLAGAAASGRRAGVEQNAVDGL